MRLLLLTLPILAIAACGSSDAVDDYNDYAADQRSLVTKVCSCETNPAACEAEIGTTAAEEACIRDIVAANDTPELREALQCQGDVLRDFLNCLNPLACDDFATDGQACANAADAAEEACPDVPAAVDAEVEAMCFN